MDGTESNGPNVPGLGAPTRGPEGTLRPGTVPAVLWGCVGWEGAAAAGPGSENGFSAETCWGGCCSTCCVPLGAACTFAGPLPLICMSMTNQLIERDHEMSFGSQEFEVHRALLIGRPSTSQPIDASLLVFLLELRQSARHYDMMSTNNAGDTEAYHMKQRL